MKTRAYKVRFARPVVGDGGVALGVSLAALHASHSPHLPALDLGSERFQVRDLHLVGRVWKGTFGRLRDGQAGRWAGSGAAACAAACGRIAGGRSGQRERRLRDLQERIVPVAERDLLQHREACKARQEALERSQNAYVQNLWGKTHSAQMASEMAANAALCDTKDRELKEALDVARRECVQLGGCR